MQSFTIFVIVFILLLFAAAFFMGGNGYDSFEELDASLKSQIEEFQK